MLVRVKLKGADGERTITRKAYELRKHKYVFLGNAPEGSDLHSFNSQDITIQPSETVANLIQLTESESPNQKTTAQEKESGAVAVVANDAPTERRKPGPKPKQISSPSSVVEV